jgi:hypothetical protein
MPEENEILAGSSFDVETGIQTVYGSVFSYGDLATSGSVVIIPTGSLPSSGDSLNGQVINLQLSTTGSLYFFDGITWKQIMLTP